jgi:hypothetical protein
MAVRVPFMRAGCAGLIYLVFFALALPGLWSFFERMEKVATDVSRALCTPAARTVSTRIHREDGRSHTAGLIEKLTYTPARFRPTHCFPHE